MKLHQFRFKAAALKGLPEAERVFFVQLAQVANDLREIDFFCIGAANTVQKTKGVDQQVALHQLLFGVRLMYGALYEGWNVIRTGWDGSGLGKKHNTHLPQNVQDALKYLRRYFGNAGPLVQTIRNEFAFHYDTENLKEPIEELGSDEELSFVTGGGNGNAFYDFAEKLRNKAMVKATGMTDHKEAVIEIYTKAGKVMGPFRTFSDALLVATVKKIGYSTDCLETKMVSDLRNISVPIFHHNTAADLEPPVKAPISPGDRMARLQKIFPNGPVADSQATMDEERGSR